MAPEQAVAWEAVAWEALVEERAVAESVVVLVPVVLVPVVLAVVKDAAARALTRVVVAAVVEGLEVETDPGVVKGVVDSNRGEDAVGRASIFPYCRCSP